MEEKPAYDRRWARGLTRNLFPLGAVAVLWVSLVPHLAAAAPAYPLQVAPGQHYLVDQNNAPFFIQGDSPWYLVVDLTFADTDCYLSNRMAQGFNSIILCLLPSKDGGNAITLNGYIPFTNTIAGPYTNLLAWDTNYFTNVDWVIQRAAYYGINVFAYPMYDGYGGDDWYQEMAGNPTNSLFLYGQFIGNRYKNFKNIVWIGAGDFDEPNGPNYLWNWIAAGILSADTNHLMTAQCGPYDSARSVYNTFWCTLNDSYPRHNTGPLTTYDFAIANYEVTPVIPSFSREAWYENNAILDINIDGYLCRTFAWGSCLYGEAGFMYGNAFIWQFGPNWQASLYSPGSTVTNVGKLLNTRNWWNCVPDTNQSVITGGNGNYGDLDFITCTREATGKTVIAYIPSGTMTPTVAMTNISGATANAWWYNPSSGAATLIGTYATTGTQTFTPPDTNDWVLVLDDSAQKYPPPGAQQIISLGIQSQGGSVYQLTVTGSPGQGYALQYTTNFGLPWQTLGSGVIDPSGSKSYQVIGLPTSVFFRSVVQ